LGIAHLGLIFQPDYNRGSEQSQEQNPEVAILKGLGGLYLAVDWTVYDGLYCLESLKQDKVLATCSTTSVEFDDLWAVSQQRQHLNFLHYMCAQQSVASAVSLCKARAIPGQLWHHIYAQV
jgi:hypothetical protein